MNNGQIGNARRVPKITKAKRLEATPIKAAAPLSTAQAARPVQPLLQLLERLLGRLNEFVIGHMPVLPGELNGSRLFRSSGDPQTGFRHGGAALGAASPQEALAQPMAKT
jgi:hypothetical protein